MKSLSVALAASLLGAASAITREKVAPGATLTFNFLVMQGADLDQLRVTQNGEPYDWLAMGGVLRTRGATVEYQVPAGAAVNHDFEFELCGAGVNNCVGTAEPIRVVPGAGSTLLRTRLLRLQEAAPVVAAPQLAEAEPLLAEAAAADSEEVAGYEIKAADSQAAPDSEVVAEPARRPCREEWRKDMNHCRPFGW